MGSAKSAGAQENLRLMKRALNQKHGARKIRSTPALPHRRTALRRKPGALNPPRQQSLPERATQRGKAPPQDVEAYRRVFDRVDEGFCIVEVLFDEHDK